MILIKLSYIYLIITLNFFNSVNHKTLMFFFLIHNIAYRLHNE